MNDKLGELKERLTEIRAEKWGAAESLEDAQRSVEVATEAYDRAVRAEQVALIEYLKAGGTLEDVEE